MSSAVIVVSDLHLGPGSNSGDYESFTEGTAFCEFLSYYAKNAEYKQLELVVAGDFFDSIQVKLSGLLLDRVYEQHALEKIKRIVAGHPDVFSQLREFTNSSGRSVTFLVGNHDPATAFESVKSYLREIINASMRFEAREVCRDYIVVRHGNQWDAANHFENDQILQTDSEGLFIRFPWGSYLVIRFVSNLRKWIPSLDHIKPIGAFIRWSLLHRPWYAIIALVHFSHFLFYYRFHPKRDQRISFLKLRQILRGTCYSCNLLNEATRFLKERTRTALILGHTHRAMLHWISDELGYVNSGTWMPIIVFQNGKYTSRHHRTFVIATIPASHPKESVKLMEWLPGKGAVEFNPTFFNIHLHEGRNKFNA